MLGQHADPGVRDCLGTIRYFDGILADNRGGSEHQETRLQCNEEASAALEAHGLADPVNRRCVDRERLAGLDVAKCGNYDKDSTWITL